MQNKANDIKKVPVEKGNYIAGFVDGEGSFYISARKRTDYYSNWRFTVHFNVSNTDKTILEICKKYIGCGKVRESRPGFYTLEVENLDNIKTFVVPFFRKFGFLSNKKTKEFSVFRRALLLLENKIKTKQELSEFLKLRAQLNELRSTRVTNTDAIIYETFIFLPSEEFTVIEESSETIR